MGKARKREPTAKKTSQALVTEITEWLKEIRTRENKGGPRKGKLYLNAQQYQTVEEIALRVMQEEKDKALGQEGQSEPLRKMLHGGPGTGKSHVLKVIRA